jgi:hypothetical protein
VEPVSASSCPAVMCADAESAAGIPGDAGAGADCPPVGYGWCGATCV